MMTDILLTLLLSSQRLNAHSGATSRLASREMNFSSLLSGMMLNSGNDPLNNSTSPGGNSLEPVLFLLLDQLVRKQKSKPDTPKVSPSNQTSSAPSNFEKKTEINTEIVSRGITKNINSGSLNASQVRPNTSQEDASIPFGRPADVGSLTQGYNPRHFGLDFGIVQGTPVKSTMEGKVTYSGWNSQGYGNLVIIDNGTYSTYYAHLSKLMLNKGDTVQAGQVIGLSGNTGNSTGPHLHYEIRKNGVPIDPTYQTFQRK